KDEKLERLLDRVRKLLALAQSNNRHEAENAASAAQRLIMQYNLELLPTARDDHEWTVRYLGPVYGRVQEHQRVVGRILLDHFGVKVVWTSQYRVFEGKYGSQLEVCGSLANVEMAAYVHDFLHASAERLWSEHKREHNIRGNRDRLTFAAGV